MNCQLSVTVLTLSIALFSACSTKVEGLVADPSFTYQSLTSSKLVTAAVTSAIKPLPSPTAISFAQDMKIAIIAERLNVAVIDAGVLRLKLGGKKFDAMRADFRQGAVLPPKWFPMIASALPNARYAAFARIEENVAKVSRDTEKVYETEKVNGVDKKKHVADKHIAKAERRMSAFMVVYDIKLGKDVWSGRVTKTATDSKNYERNLRGGDDTVGIIVDVIGSMGKGNEELYPYPPMPDSRPLLMRIFRGFAENFPEGK